MAVELAVQVPKVQYTTSPKEFPKVLLEAREVVQSSVGKSSIYGDFSKYQLEKKHQPLTIHHGIINVDRIK
jgi:hypothetical protein